MRRHCFGAKCTGKRIVLLLGALLYYLFMYYLLPVDKENQTVLFQGENDGNTGQFQERRQNTNIFFEKQPVTILANYNVVGGSDAFRQLVVPSSEWNDRIEKQLSHLQNGFIPGIINGSRLKEEPEINEMIYIYVPGGLQGLKPGDEEFRSDNCPIARCFLSGDSDIEETAQARLILGHGYVGHQARKPPYQIWILWSTESPMNTPSYKHLFGKVNWTATYRADSTLPTPYGKYIKNDDLFIDKQRTPFEKSKHKKVAWFVSNCDAKNTRLKYAKALSRYIEVDIFGNCGGRHVCPRTDPSSCDITLKEDYMFYLSFENSNCKHYITEKLFVNALRNDVLPVVMGARKKDYIHTAPPASFLHVESFHSPRMLAKYLHKLAANDTLYNTFFQWKEHYIYKKTSFWCRLCSMLHDNQKSSVWYDDVDDWWRDADTCTRDRWDDPRDKIKDWKNIIYDA